MKFKFKGELDIEISGKSIGFTWNMAALAMLCDIRNKGITGIAKEMMDPALGTIAAFLYVGAVKRCEKEKRKVDFTEDQAAEWLGEIGLKECLDLFNKAFESPEEEKNALAQETTGPTEKAE